MWVFYRCPRSFSHLCCSHNSLTSLLWCHLVVLPLFLLVCCSPWLCSKPLDAGSAMGCWDLGTAMVPLASSRYLYTHWPCSAWLLSPHCVWQQFVPLIFTQLLVFTKLVGILYLCEIFFGQWDQKLLRNNGCVNIISSWTGAHTKDKPTQVLR